MGAAAWSTLISVVTGFVGDMLALAFPLPPGAEGFKFFAIFGIICGFGVGGVLSTRARFYRPITLGSLIIIDFVIGFITALWYIYLISVGASTGVRSFVLLAMLLAITFFCFGFVLPLAGISLTRARPGGDVGAGATESDR